MEFQRGVRQAGALSSRAETALAASLSSVEPRSRKRAVSVVYFVQCGDGGPVKIGVTRDLDKRLGGLQTSHHERLRLLHVEPGGRLEERQFHARFADLRTRGEWFLFDGALVAFLTPRMLP
jgi:hypothetical protein